LRLVPPDGRQCTAIEVRGGEDGYEWNHGVSIVGERGGRSLLKPKTGQSQMTSSRGRYGANLPRHHLLSEKDMMKR